MQSGRKSQSSPDIFSKLKSDHKLKTQINENHLARLLEKYENDKAKLKRIGFDLGKHDFSDKGSMTDQEYISYLKNLNKADKKRILEIDRKLAKL